MKTNLSKIHHYSTFFGATVLAGVMDICPYFLIFYIITRGEYWVVHVVATKKRGIMTICWASLSRSHDIHSNPKEKSLWKTLGGCATSGFSLKFFSCFSWIFMDPLHGPLHIVPISPFRVQTLLQIKTLHWFGAPFIVMLFMLKLIYLSN